MVDVGNLESIDDINNHDESDSDVSSVSASSRENFLTQVTRLRSKSFTLPQTVSLIECDNGTKVYIVGTAHFSLESIEDVKFIMDNTLPEIVLVELCRGRGHSMLMDEEQIKEQIKENSIISFVKNLGVSNGILQYLLLRFTSYIVDQIGMAPGGEFRAAFQKASQQPHCHLVLGDRPISITMHRTLDALGVWKKTKLFFSLLFGLEPITKEDIEAMKKSDLLEQLVKSLAGEYPELTKSILEERDLYLARSIWDVCGIPQLVSSRKRNQPTDDDEVEIRNRSKNPSSESSVMCVSSADSTGDDAEDVSNIRCCPEWPTQAQLPRVVVAVVGIGHVAGIQKAWPTAASIDMEELMRCNPPSRCWKLFKWTLRLTFLSTFVFGSYWCLRGIYCAGFYAFDRISIFYTR